MFKIGDRVRIINCGRYDCHSLSHTYAKEGYCGVIASIADGSGAYPPMARIDGLPGDGTATGHYLCHLELIEPKKIEPLPLPG